MFKDLDPILHSQLRLAIISLLISVDEAEFNFLKEKTNATSGNLSVQLDKLKTRRVYRSDQNIQEQLPAYRVQDH